LRALAVDAGTGDGGLLDVIAPVFERVVAIDRSEAQLAMARARMKHRNYGNVTLVHGELDGRDALAAAGGKADVVFAARLLHHATKPAAVVAKLSELCRPGGALVVLDYARHDDERMRDQADVWLGFSPRELERLADGAGFEQARIASLPSALHGSGPDAHLPWQVMVAIKATASSQKKNKERHHG
jgi:ArsR family transcriptional regulator